MGWWIQRSFWTVPCGLCGRTAKPNHVPVWTGVCKDYLEIQRWSIQMRRQKNNKKMFHFFMHSKWASSFYFDFCHTFIQIRRVNPVQLTNQASASYWVGLLDCSRKSDFSRWREDMGDECSVDSMECKLVFYPAQFPVSLYMEVCGEGRVPHPEGQGSCKTKLLQPLHKYKKLHKAAGGCARMHYICQWLIAILMVASSSITAWNNSVQA